MHPDVDQFLRIEQGQGIVMMGDRRNNLNFRRRVHDGYVIFVPAGKWHNLVNTGRTPLKLYSIYAPPEHPRGTVHKIKRDAEKHRLTWIRQSSFSRLIKGIGQDNRAVPLSTHNGSVSGTIQVVLHLPSGSKVATQFRPLAFALYRASSAIFKRSSILLISSVLLPIAATPMLTV